MTLASTVISMFKAVQGNRRVSQAPEPDVTFSRRHANSADGDSGDSAYLYREKLSLILLALGAIALLFWRLGAASLNDWDEAIYAQIAKEVVTTGDWLTLHWGYAPWFHKPPLFMWMTALGFKLFGVSEFWARVPSAVSGVGLVGCTYAIARKLYSRQDGSQDDSQNGSQDGNQNGNPALGHAIGLLSATVLLTNYTFIHFSRFGTTDITLTLFCYLAVYAYLHVHEGRQRAWYGVWAAVALAMMTKGVAGVPVAIALFLTVLFTGRLMQALRCRSFWLGIGLAGLIIVPWHWAMVAIHGQAFIDQYLIYHVLERSTGGGLEGNDGGYFYYVSVLGKRFFPWVYLLPLALLQQARWLRQPKGSLGLVLLMFVGVVFGGFSLASTKLAWYIIPIYPAIAIWIGALLHQALVCKDRLVWMGLLASGTIVMALFPTAIVFLPEAFTQTLTIVGLAGLMLLSVAVLEFGWRRQVLSIALCGLFIVAGIREIKGSYHGYARPVAMLSQAAELPVTADNPPKDMPLLVAKLSERLYTPTPLFYSNRPIAWVRSVADLAAATDTTRKQDILLATTDIKDLSARFDIDVYAKEGALTYAGIRKRDL